MTRFEYAAIFYGLIVGLAIQNILSSIHKLIEAGPRVRWHWMAPATALYATILTLANFWIWFHSRGMATDSNFLHFLPRAIAMGVLFLMCAATLPDDVPERGVDLRIFYFDNLHRFWGLYIATFTLNTLNWVPYMVGHGFALGEFLLPALSNVPGIVVGLVSMRVRAPWWHAIAIVGNLIAMLVLYGPMQLT